MATGIILAGGQSTRMPGDKAFMEVAGRRVLDIQLEALDGLFDEIILVVNAGRVSQLAPYESGNVRVAEEPVAGKGPLGAILSGLRLSHTDENFVLACDMPFVNREAAAYVVECLEGYQVAVPRTPKGLEPLHAAYRRSCEPVIARQLGEGNLKVTDFFGQVATREIPWEEMKRFDPTGRLLLNINSPEDMKRAAGIATSGSGHFVAFSGAVMVDGTAGRTRLAEHMSSAGGLPPGAVALAGPGGGPPGGAGAEAGGPGLTVLLLEEPLERLVPPARKADIVLVELGPAFEGVSELGLEADLKAATGAAKVLIYSDDAGRLRAFEKVYDMALSRTGGGQMPEDISQEVLDAVKEAAVEGKIACERAQELAGELGVPIPEVGRALDLLQIKIVHCQLGCF